MSSWLPKKIKKALRRGDIVPHEEVLADFSPTEREEIHQRARYIRAAMELRRLRRRMKLSQQQLAKRMDVKREFVSRIESGKQNITLETLYRIAEATGKEFKFSFK